jgi:D-3-phosphoglycerate dehydrogenase
VEIPINGTLLLIRNQDRPGIVGHLGTVLGHHGVNIANMSLSRDAAGGQALTVLHLDNVPPAAALTELAKDPAITSARVVTL